MKTWADSAQKGWGGMLGTKKTKYKNSTWNEIEILKKMIDIKGDKVVSCITSVHNIGQNKWNRGWNSKIS